MLHDEAGAATYFRLTHEFQHGTPIMKGLVKLVDLIRDRIEHNQPAQALEGLNGLKGYLAQVELILSAASKQRDKYLVEVQILRRENLLLALSIAKYVEDASSITELEKALARMDEFFEAGIADLDSEKS